MFREFKEERFHRFKEFDEAREFIEKFSYSKDTFDAIDYMINHKEYYFLLKNILRQLPDERIVEYVFFNLPCLKREEDLNILISLLTKYPVVKNYIKSCKNREFAKKIYESGLKKDAIDIFKYIPDISEWLKEKIKDEDADIKKKAIEFFEIFDEKFAEKLKKEVKSGN
ncbi:hypothetical protein [Caminibacter sp.]